MNSVGSTSPELLEASKKHEAAAWEQLVVLYSPLVYSWARLAGLSAEDASDIVQNVLRAVFTNLRNFDVDRSDGSFRGWLRTITNNKIIDRHRREQKHVPAAGGSDAQSLLSQYRDCVDPSSESDSFDSGELRQALDRIRGDFTLSTWQAFWGMTVECRSSPDLGQELGMTAAAVRLARIRVLRRLRREMNLNTE